MRFALFFAMLVPSVAHAQAVTYQDRLMGQRALGLGGAFTGIANDPTATFYNPAGLANLQHRQIEIGLPILGFDYQRIKGGLIQQAADRRDADTFSVLSLPTTVGVATGVGLKDSENREVIVFSATLMIPWQRSFALRQVKQDADLNAFDIWQESDQTLLIGPGMGVRLGMFSFGLSLYYTHHNLSWINSRSFARPDGAAGNLSSTVEGWLGAINPRVGFMLQPTPRWSVGLMFSMSSHRIWGDGNIRMTSTRVETGKAIEQTLYSVDGVHIDRPLPWEFRLGVGYKPVHALTLSADVTAYMPQRFTYFRDIDEGLGGAPASVKRNFVMNGNVGAEYYVNDGLWLRFGAFTNLTAADAPKTECAVIACVDYVNSAGVTASVGFKAWRVALDVGVNATLGLGTVQQFVGPSQYAWSRYERYAWNIFLGGNLGNVINLSTQQLKDVIEKNGFLK